MSHLDLDKVHAAERESKGEGPTVTLGGETYTLPSKLPLAVAVGQMEGNLRLMVECLFGVDNTEQVLRHLRGEDMDRIASLYGLDAPNSEPSAG